MGPGLKEARGRETLGVLEYKVLSYFIEDKVIKL